jgi:hypothetical protein
MAHYANDDDRLLDRTIDRWKQNAAYEIDDIGGWREAAEKRPTSGDESRQWGKPPRMFYSDTAYIIGAITSRYPKLDPTPLIDLNEAVTAWHADHNAERIPAQPRLWATLDRAMLTLQAIESDIGSRMSGSKTESSKALKDDDPEQHKDANHIAFLQGNRIIIGEKAVVLGLQEQDVINALVKLRAADLPTLKKQSGYKHAATVLKRLVNKRQNRILKQFITMPGGRGRGGYSTTIQAVVE